MTQDQTALFLDALQQHLNDLQRLSTELHLHAGTEHEADMWFRLHSASTRVCGVAELGLQASSSHEESTSPDLCECGERGESPAEARG